MSKIGMMHTYDMNLQILHTRSRNTYQAMLLIDLSGPASDEGDV